MKKALEIYSVRLPAGIKKMIKILAAQQDCTQQDLITRLIEKEGVEKNVFI